VIILKAILKLLDITVIFITIAVVFILSVNVVLRYGFGMSIGPWSRELTTFGLIWMTFLLSPRLLEEDAHFTVPVIVEEKIKSAKIRFIVNLLTRGLMIWFFYAVTRESGVFFRLRSYAMTLRIRKSYIYLVVPFVFVISIVIILTKLYEEFKNLKKE